MDAGNLIIVLVVTTITSGVFALWLILVAVSRLLYRRARGLPLIARTYHAVDYSSSSKALYAANERRERLRGFLSEYADRRVVSQEFIELPPKWDVPLWQVRRQFSVEQA